MATNCEQHVGRNSGVTVNHISGSLNVSSENGSDLSNECIQSLFLTDPRDDRQQILRRKDALMSDTCEWIRHDEAFITWWDTQQEGDKRQILWLHGDAGKGKTMMIMSLIDEVGRRVTEVSLAQPRPTSSPTMAYYFCQTANASANTAQAVIRGLIFFLVAEHPHLVEHVVRYYRVSGSKFFERADILDSLWRVLKDICADPKFTTVYLLVDALDECDHGLEDLLKLMSRPDLALSSKVKWLVSSRNEGRISRILFNANRPSISLEVNAERVSHAIERYIDFKIQDSGFSQTFGSDTANSVRSYLQTHANGTFLWVWLVCQQLLDLQIWDNVMEEVQKFPEDLYDIYERMLQRVKRLKDASYCFALIQAAEKAPRPLSLEEAWFVANLPREKFQNPKAIKELAKHCGSLFVVRDNVLGFVHKSALDYLQSPAAATFFNLDAKEAHAHVYKRSIQTLRSNLRQDICGVRLPGTPIERISKDLVQLSMPAEVRYACRYWIYHVKCCLLTEEDVELIYTLMEHSFLFWLEALCLMGNARESIGAIETLQTIPQVQASRALNGFIQDAKRFVQQSLFIAENTPLQLYSSALIFAPMQSVIRKAFQACAPSWISQLPAVEETWGPCLRTLELHLTSFQALAFSPDIHTIASASADTTVQLWDADAGSLRKTLQGHSGLVWAVVFSPDGRTIASGSEDMTVKLWDVSRGALRRTLKGHSRAVLAVVFSPDGRTVASGSEDMTVKLWDVPRGTVLRTLEGHSDMVWVVAVSPDSYTIASGSKDMTVKLWNANTGAIRNTLQGHSGPVLAVVFSPDGRTIASGSEDRTIKLWDADTGVIKSILQGHFDMVSAVVFSPDGYTIATGSWDRTVRLWDVNTGAVRSTLQGHWQRIEAVSFSLDGYTIVSVSLDATVKLWSANLGTIYSNLQGHPGGINRIAFSPDGHTIVSGSEDAIIKLWDAKTGTIRSTLKGHLDLFTEVVFSPDGRDLTPEEVALSSGLVRLWDDSNCSLPESLETRRFVERLPFEEHKLNLETNRTRLWSQYLAQYKGLSAASAMIGLRGAWVLWEGEKLLWLPSDYRSSCSALYLSKLALGRINGLVTIIGFDVDALRQVYLS